MEFSGRLSQPVTIYKRAGVSAGGTKAERYLPLRETGAYVRDESTREHDEHEAALTEHVLYFTLRVQDVPSDGLIGWNGGYYRVKRVDRGDYRGRRMRVSAYRVEPRATIAQDEVLEDGEVRV